MPDDFDAVGSMACDFFCLRGGGGAFEVEAWGTGGSRGCEVDVEGTGRFVDEVEPELVSLESRRRVVSEFLLSALLDLFAGLDTSGESEVLLSSLSPRLELSKPWREATDSVSERTRTSPSESRR